MKNHVNLKKEASTNYKFVQKTIWSTIRTHLPKDQVSATKTKLKKDAVNLSFFIRNPANVLMSHGVADKNYMFIKDDNGGRLLNEFDHVLVPGPWLKKRILKNKAITLTENQIHVVGWPRLDHLCELQRKSLRGRLSKFVKSTLKLEKTNVLWAPTHNYVTPKKLKFRKEDKSASSFPDMCEFTKDLESQFNYNIALHPRNQTKKQRKPTTEMLVKADVVISDFGTMVYEAWSLGKPVIFPRWIIKDRVINLNPGSAEALIFEKRIGLHADSYEELVEMAKKNKRVGHDVKEFMEEYLPSKYLGKSGKVIAELLTTLPIQNK
ncbi:CDP-glycerol glycerophosphotransferase family protein [Psychrosphaera sp.]|nr:CDP-glycerol glycerophosphotransferase family protein [Psychrosphaera sp.]